jgi:adenylylsulfate kinase
MASREKEVNHSEFKIAEGEKLRKLVQVPKLIWLTGLSGSGKSSLAEAIRKELCEVGFSISLLDSDRLRTGLNQDLGYREEDFMEKIRRTGEVAKLMLDSGQVVISASISPFRSEREKVAKLVGKTNFIEIYMDCPFEICEHREVKGLYKKARAGEIDNFIRINSFYEPPLAPTIHIHSDREDMNQSLAKVLRYVIPEINCNKKRDSFKD